MRIPYNFDAVRINAETVWEDRTAPKMTADHFRQLDLVRWVEKNIGEMYDPVPGEMLHGIGWYIIAEFDPGGRGTMHYLDVDDGKMTELQMTEFLLRFG
jgi:hypothetical protein